MVALSSRLSPTAEGKKIPRALFSLPSLKKLRQAGVYVFVEVNKAWVYVLAIVKIVFNYRDWGFLSGFFRVSQKYNR